MPATGYRPVLGAFLAALLFPWAPPPVHGAPPVLLRASTAEEFLALGMPLSARQALLSLPGGERGSSPLLPRALRELSAAGHGKDALSLFAATAPSLAEPVRSEAFLEAGKIHWGRKEYEEAERTFREVERKSSAGPEAAYYLGRILASRGKSQEALAVLASAHPGAKTALARGELEMARGNTAAALAAWENAADGTPAGFAANVRALSHDPDRSLAALDLQAISRSAGAGTPEHTLSLSALAQTFLRAGDRKAALGAAREGIASAGRLRDRVLGFPEWDGTSAGARESWDAMVGLFPYGAEAGAFYRAGGRFLAVADIEDTLRAAENGARTVARRVRSAERSVTALHDNVAGILRRTEEIRSLFLHYGGIAGGMRERLRNAADSLPLAGRGKTVDPGISRLLLAIERRQAEIRERLSRVGTAFKAKSVNDWSPPLSPEDRLMVLYIQLRLSRLEDSLRVLEGKVALLRGKVWNRWKAGYASDLSRLLDGSEAAAAAAPKGAAKAERTLAELREAFERQKAWFPSFRKMDARLAEALTVLSGRRGETRTAAAAAFRDARLALLSAVERDGRAMRYVAARAATEWLIDGKGSLSEGAALPAEERKALRAEAIGHWEKALPPAGESRDVAAEGLYALAELRLEEADSRYFGQEGDTGARKEYEAPVALFRRVIEEVPDSPYEEPALYGLAVAYQGAGATDNSIAAMESLLARFPGTRFSDEVSLRLGESEFDRYEFREAERHYRNVRDTAPPDLLITARFKLGWSLFLQERPGDAAAAFLSSLLLSPSARRTGGMAEESVRMIARSLVDSDLAPAAETFLAERGAAAHGPAVLLQIQAILDQQNRYAEAAGIADRFASAYPYAAERINAEVAAAEVLRKADRQAESNARKRGFHEIFGPGSRWQAAPGRAAGDIARADMVSEEGLRAASFYFHAKTREQKGGDRAAVLAGYDAYLSLFPTSPKTEEVAYQRAWLLFEAGRKKEAKTAFEAVARLPGNARGEAAWYMAVQSAKDIASISDPGSQAEVIRLSREYERAHPKGDRIAGIRLDRARSHFNLREFSEAADASSQASQLFPEGPERRKTLRILGDARFEMADYAGSEKAFREILAHSPEPGERRDVEKWVAFSLFRRAEGALPEKAAEAAALFRQAAREFPSQEIAETALFRAGTAGMQAGAEADAIAAFLAVESEGKDKALVSDSTRWLARLYEKTGNRPAAAERYERLAAGEGDKQEKGELLLRAAELLAGIDEPRSRRNFVAVASLPETPAAMRISSLFRAAESARGEGKTDEADRYYEETVNAHRAAPAASPETAGKALFRRGEFRFARYRALSIVPPLEKTFAAKQAALEAASALYVEAVRIGDAETVSASLHRLGEGLEDFRTAVLGSPPPKGLSEREREEYVFLLEERAAPIEEKAVEAYLKNLRQAVAGDFFSPWAEKSLDRLKSLRPARFAKKGEYAFPVATVPEFVGIIERRNR